MAEDWEADFDDEKVMMQREWNKISEGFRSVCI